VPFESMITARLGEIIYRFQALLIAAVISFFLMGLLLMQKLIPSWQSRVTKAPFSVDLNQNVDGKMKQNSTDGGGPAKIAEAAVIETKKPNSLEPTAEMLSEMIVSLESQIASFAKQNSSLTKVLLQ